MPDNKQPVVQAFILLVILIVSPLLVYWPGISGQFMLDDIANLQNLEYRGGVDSFDDARYFIFEGVSSSLGRPISMASFLIDAQNWPAVPHPFKYTNILIHALSTLLLFAALLKLFQVLGKGNKQGLVIAAMAALLWSIHPLQTSTVLYVVQRMTELAALFVFAGLWCYLHGRLRVSSHAGAGYIWMSVAVLIFTSLATLSKENGILLPLLILVTELTLLSQVARPKYWRYWAIPMLGIPILFVAGYLVMAIVNSETGFSGRDFTLYERALTQSRILMDYISNILLPINTPSLLHDDFTLSNGLFSPVSTFLSLLFIATAIIAAIMMRKKYSVVSFAILWFFAAHVLESSVLSLELYYEHRNYLPLAGPALAAAYYASVLINKYKQRAAIGVALAFIAIATSTWNYSNIWGDDEKLQATWYKEHPDSVRTTIRYAMNLIKDMDVDPALAASSRMIEKYPEHMTARIFHTTLLCLADRLTPESYQTLADMAASKHYDASAFGRFKHLYELVRDKYCVQISPRGMLNLVNKFIENPHTTTRGSMVRMGYYLMKSEIYSNHKKVRPTLKALDQAFLAHPTIDILLKKTHLLSILRNFDKAEETLNLARMLDRMRGRLIPSRANELDNAQMLIDAGREAIRQQNQETR